MTGVTSSKPRVVRSINAPGESMRVDVLRHDDGQFGWCLYRRDTEDHRGWFEIERSASRFVSEEDALAGARARFEWMQAPPGN